MNANEEKPRAPLYVPPPRKPIDPEEPNDEFEPDSDYGSDEFDRQLESRYDF